MNILVTGGAGFIGSHTCKALRNAGYNPIAFDNLRTGHAWSVRYGPFEHGDILDTLHLAQALIRYRIEVVMHFAALAYVGESIAHPDIYYRTNVTGTLSLLNAMRLSGVKHIVFSSSCATYGPIDRRIEEGDEQRPINPYGASKLMGERLCQDYASSYGIAAVALRYFNAAGSDPDGELGEVHHPETHLIPIVLEVAAGMREHVDVFGTDWPTRDGTCVRDYIHVCDLADAHIAALSVFSEGEFKAFNLGNGSGYSVKQVIDQSQRVTGRTLAWRAGPRRPGDPASLIANAEFATSTLGWKPKHPNLDQMISHAWNFHTKRAHNLR